MRVNREQWFQPGDGVGVHAVGATHEHEHRGAAVEPDLAESDPQLCPFRDPRLAWSWR